MSRIAELCIVQNNCLKQKFFKNDENIFNYILKALFAMRVFEFLF